jgi:hypothetical protein
VVKSLISDINLEAHQLKQNTGNDTLEKVCLETLSFLFLKQQVSPFPDKTSFAFTKGNFFPEFKFYAQLNSLEKAFIFLEPLKGTLNWQDNSKAVEKAVSFSRLA